MCSGTGTHALPCVGSPIRKSPGRRLFSTSPGLIAAVHVLHRLLAPRHPPLALNILTIFDHLCRYVVFKVRAGAPTLRRRLLTADEALKEPSRPGSRREAPRTQMRGRRREARRKGTRGGVFQNWTAWPLVPEPKLRQRRGRQRST